MVKIGLFMIMLFSVMVNYSIYATENDKFILLGTNEKAEVHFSSGSIVSLDIGINPMQVITSSTNQKVILCAGDTNKSEQGATLLLLNNDLNSIEKRIELNSALKGYAVNNNNSMAWLVTGAGLKKKADVYPKLYLVSLETLEIIETVLESMPCQIALSGDETLLAVTTIGENDTANSKLAIYDANTLRLIDSFDIAKNPGILEFSQDDQTLIVAGYGFRDTFKIPLDPYAKLTQQTSAEVGLVDLENWEMQEIDLGDINQEFAFGENDMVYGIISQENNGIIKAVGSKINWEIKCDFIPKYVQDWPGTDQLIVIGGEAIEIVNKKTGESQKQLSAGNDVVPFTFLDGSEYAYSYNMQNLRLNVMNLNTLSLDKPVKVGSAGLVALKTLAVIGSAIQPQSVNVNGVRIQRTNHIYHVYTPKGNMVACPERNKIYMLNSYLNRIYVYDMLSGKVTKKIVVPTEKAVFIQKSPNDKYIILASGDKWMLVNVETDQSTLKFNPTGVKVTFIFQAVTAPTPFFSPDGEMMYIPEGTKVTVIDLNKGKKLKAIKTETKDASVWW